MRDRHHWQAMRDDDDPGESAQLLDANAKAARGHARPGAAATNGSLSGLYPLLCNPPSRAGALAGGLAGASTALLIDIYMVWSGG